ncbi:hypothetical protein BCR32DRAFT_286315 [Anaeromyces robustus]|uniref:L domain-like protein n=1 Tax=Anaeromyces robustus TaxID=1754192 RepID=A0A1Y1VYR6_9FUNG|nr:hypothetical protein BCR32DRAFT_286315 [Anaeromyces robustus]|eukprot:ORX66407.1 hypothetical protein BCR32DRAFT_286315 [Anaeromyces robustus]
MPLDQEQNKVNLEKLNLHSNQLAEFPSEIGKLVNLKELSLYELTKLPSEIRNLVNLNELDLPPEMGNLYEGNLDVYYNDIEIYGIVFEWSKFDAVTIKNIYKNLKNLISVIIVN